MPPIAKDNELLTATPQASARTASPAVLSGETAPKPQPVALEVPVTVNGARTVDGSDKREPFSESTKTVLVFGNGAVIRLSSSVAPGQLLFLTNEKTKKEVVCQVVKSKNYRNVSGYVELEFTEPVVGFWGMRFPGDRIAPPSQAVAASSASVNSPVASLAPAVSSADPPKTEAPVVNLLPKVSEPKPATPQLNATESAGSRPAPIAFAPPPQASEIQAPPKLESSLPPEPLAPAAPMAPIPTISATQEFSSRLAPEKPDAPATSLFDAPAPSEKKASFLEPSPAPPAKSTFNLGNLAPFFEVKPAAESKPAHESKPDAESKLAASSPAPAPPASSPQDSETEALKQQTARLQEQLSSLLFTEKVSAKAEQELPRKNVQLASAAPIVEKAEPKESAGKVPEIAKMSDPAPVPQQPAGPASTAPVLRASSLDAEELKIPAWLEPLTRNASAPVSTQELIERERAKRIAEQAKTNVEEVAEEPPAVARQEQEKIFDLPTPTFGNSLPIGRSSAADQTGSRSSGKGVLIGAIAAGILLLAGGGAWYLRQQSSGAPANNPAATPSAAVSVPAASLPAQGNSPVQTGAHTAAKPDVPVSTVAQSKSGSDSSTVETVSMSTPEGRNQKGTSLAPKNAAEVAALEPSRPAPAQPKKPGLGEVRLEAPKIAQREKPSDSSDTGEGLASNEIPAEPDGVSESLGADLAGKSKQPAAPPAPVAVGGDIKPARLMASVPPEYPMLAKNQHITGNVVVDALIDSTGRVTTMKVISGPALLQRAAMDALRKWKYQPASLDDKPVAMHLTVTLQFRLQ